MVRVAVCKYKINSSLLFYIRMASNIGPFPLCHPSAGMVQYADIKMENGKSKGCGVVRFDNPETAERACRTMNGYRLNGREIDVRIDRNA